MIELPAILAIAWFACVAIVRRHGLSPRERIVMGAVWFALFLMTEIALGVWLRGWTPAETLADFQTAPGALGLMAFVLAAGFPAMVRGRKRRNSARSHASRPGSL